MYTQHTLDANQLTADAFAGCGADCLEPCAQCKKPLAHRAIAEKTADYSALYRPPPLFQLLFFRHHRDAAPPSIQFYMIVQGYSATLAHLRVLARTLEDSMLSVVFPAAFETYRADLAVDSEPRHDRVVAAYERVLVKSIVAMRTADPALYQDTLDATLCGLRVGAPLVRMPPPLHIACPAPLPRPPPPRAEETRTDSPTTSLDPSTTDSAGPSSA
jgi:hypothetical protein